MSVHFVENAVAPPPAGHNQGPEDIQAALRDRLTEGAAALLKRTRELLEAEERCPAAVDDETAGQVADYIKLITACSKALDTARVGEKEPFLASGRTVDGFFKKPIDNLGIVKRRVADQLGRYMTAKADAERRARDEAAKLAREAAERAEAEAMALAQTADVTNAQANTALDNAVQAQSIAAKAEKAADAPPAEMARTRGDLGALATVTRKWTFKDLDRATLDLDALRSHLPQAALEQAVRSFITAGGRTLGGVSIFEATTASVR